MHRYKHFTVRMLEPKDGEKLTALRTSMKRVLAAEPRDLNWGIRGGCPADQQGTAAGSPRGGGPPPPDSLVRDTRRRAS